MWYYFKSEEPGKLASWYKKWLGFYMESENPSSFKYVLMPEGSFTLWAPFESSTEYFDPVKKGFMINIIVDNALQG